MTRTEIDPTFERLLEYLKAHRSFDFTGYKRSSLMRRVLRRMQVVEVEGFDEYLDYLEVHPGEFEQLFNTILINVTQFFRDAEAWRSLADAVRELIALKSPEDPIRVWSAGCASGQEPYSVLMLLAEILGEDGLRDRVKIYATDVDEEALDEARRAVYRPRDVEELPEEMRDRYFTRVKGDYAFRPDLRRYVIFGRHDLGQDAPISHLDLLSCRNALMYFNREMQARILARFHFGLEPHGLLFLGRAEMMSSQPTLFTPLDLKARIFARADGKTMREQLLQMGGGDRAGSSPRVAQLVRLRDAVLDSQDEARVAVGANGALLLANRPARAMFGLSASDIGRPFRDLRISYTPLELRSRIEQVLTERTPSVAEGVPTRFEDGRDAVLDIRLTPLLEEGGGLLGVSVGFIDVTRSHRLQFELQQAHQELETAYEELQSTNEELETTNEELQSTIEELETTNEELQSTSEEMETMNEELQSTNEELETMNEELQSRTLELNEVSVYLESVITSLRPAVVVLDRNLDVRVWSPAAEELWGLRVHEVEGRAFLALDIGMPVDSLRGLLRACADGDGEQDGMVLAAVNRRGKAVEIRVTATPLARGDGGVGGVVLTMDEQEHESD